MLGAWVGCAFCAFAEMRVERVFLPERLVRGNTGMAAVQEALAAEVHRFDGCGADPAELRVTLDATGAVTAWTLGPTPSAGAQCVRTALADFAFPALGRPTELFLSYVPGVGVSALAGGLAPAEIAATIAAATDRFEACYERFVDAPVRGKLAVAFTIDARGRVVDGEGASVGGVLPLTVNVELRIGITHRTPL